VKITPPLTLQFREITRRVTTSQMSVSGPNNQISNVTKPFVLLVVLYLSSLGDTAQLRFKRISDHLPHEKKETSSIAIEFISFFSTNGTKITPSMAEHCECESNRNG
jgi:hypothetical protein